MTRDRARIACLGAGRMGRGIAQVFAYAGHHVDLIDFKPRDDGGFETLRSDALQEISETLALLAGFGLFDPVHCENILARIACIPERDAADALGAADVVFEGVPELVDVKRAALAEASGMMRDNAVLASTTSTILVDDLAPAVEQPQRFLNAHWLNPAFLVPLVEVSPGANTDAEVTTRLLGCLESVGKVPVVCAARPGYIVPRIQALAMNEAARMVEEGVASAEDIDKAIKYGFSFRFAVLGMLEFIDWGGGDILYHASNYLSDALDNPRYAAPDIVDRNMREGRTGLKTQQGFLNYEGLDLDAYRKSRLEELVGRLHHYGLARTPVLD